MRAVSKLRKYHPANQTLTGIVAYRKLPNAGKLKPLRQITNPYTGRID
jgi:hypothetical protein